ncbi:hypothetical protein, partial [Streptomyces sp. SID5643]
CTAATIVWGLVAMAQGRGPLESDRDRAQRLAGLHPSQHPGKERYYVPLDAVFRRAADGSSTAYLHYGVRG